MTKAKKNPLSKCTPYEVAAAQNVIGEQKLEDAFFEWAQEYFQNAETRTKESDDAFLTKLEKMLSRDLANNLESASQVEAIDEHESSLYV